MNVKFTTAAFLVTTLLSLGLARRSPRPRQNTSSSTPKRQRRPPPHFWEQTFGSGRATLTLRESYREDLRTAKQATNFESVRFHDIFLDDVGLYNSDRQMHSPSLNGLPPPMPRSTTSPTL